MFRNLLFGASAAALLGTLVTVSLVALAPTAWVQAEAARPPMKRIAAALVIPMLLAQPVRADAISFLPTLEKAGWRTVAMPGIAPAKFSVTRDDTLEVVANAAVGWLWRAVRGEASHSIRARWSWLVDEGIGPTDLTRRGGDDRALAVYFVFSHEPVAAESPVTLLNSGSARALVYVFGGNRPRGTVLSSPHMKAAGTFIVLRPADGPRLQWLDEEVNLASDYARTFSGHLPPLIALAVSSDADDTGGNRVRLRALQLNR